MLVVIEGGGKRPIEENGASVAQEVQVEVTCAFGEGVESGECVEKGEPCCEAQLQVDVAVKVKNIGRAEFTAFKTFVSSP